MDETGLFYRQLPTRSLSSMDISCGKTNKDCVTATLCCNADGTHKIDVAIIGQYARPRPLKNLVPKATTAGPQYDVANVAGSMYMYALNAWQCSATFNTWLKHFNDRVSVRHHPNSVFLLMDNSSTHNFPPDAQERVWAECLRGCVWKKVNIVFLPPNVTSHVQPLDQGIICAYKAAFRKRLVMCVFESIETAISIV